MGTGTVQWDWQRVFNVHQNGENSFGPMHQNGRNRLSSTYPTGVSTVSYCCTVMAFQQVPDRRTLMVSVSCKVCLVKPSCGHHLGDDCTIRTPDIGETTPEKRRLSMDSHIVKRQRKLEKRESSNINWDWAFFKKNYTGLLFVFPGLQRKLLLYMPS